MSWLFSQALVEEYSGPRFSDIERSVRSNSIRTPEAFSSNDRTTAIFNRSRYGMTCALLTASAGMGLLMSFLLASRARTLVLPEKELGSTEPGRASGAKLSGSWVKYDPASSSWRTAQDSLLGDSGEFSGTWPSWGLMRNGECWELDMSGLPTYESASGFLPTLTHRDYRSDKCTPEVKARRDAHPRGKTLPWVLGGLVNPPWAEWFMGWPEGWTESKPLETAKFQEWRQQHSVFLAEVPHE